MLYGHGDDGYQFKNDIVADFSTNVWYSGEPAGLKEHIFDNWNAINKYPEVIAESLAKKISGHHNLQPDNLLVNSGSTESIYLIAQAFRQKKTTIIVPAFAEYEDAANMYGHSLNFMDWQQLNPATQFKTDLVFVCNPNNPTGAVFNFLEELLCNNPQTIFVLDEAFIEFTLTISSSVALINKYKNLIVLRSLTKAYAIPGLRLGYIVSSAPLISKIKQFKYPWSVNTIALETGKFIFDNYAAIQIPITRLLQDRQHFINELQQIKVNITDSHTHFFLAEIIGSDASTLKKHLIKNHGILIRDASNFRGLGSGHFRVATLSPAKNQLLVNALKEWKNYTS